MACGGKCGERKYRASNIRTKSRYVGAPADANACKNEENGAEEMATNALKAKIDPTRIIAVTCHGDADAPCECFDIPAAFGNWRVLKAGVVLKTRVLAGAANCLFEVTLTYDYEVAERLGDCYEAPPGELMLAAARKPARRGRPAAKA